MKKILFMTNLLIASLGTNLASAQDSSIFPKGEKAANVHHTGDVWLAHVSDADETFGYNVSLATFSEGAKLDWHIHPAGQQLIITDGTGFYQERGESVQIVKKGDVVKCQPGVEHWHAATPKTGVTYLAITGNQPTKWLEPVTEEAFNSIVMPSSNTTSTEREIIELSKKKWQWMSDKNVDELNTLFHEKSKFVHMSGTWNKEEELDIIKTGRIWYKNAKVHDVAVEILANTAIVWNRITLEAIVRENEAINEFTVTEIYQKQGGDWKLLDLTFSSVRDTHQIQK